MLDDIQTTQAAAISHTVNMSLVTALRKDNRFSKNMLNALLNSLSVLHTPINTKLARRPLYKESIRMVTDSITQRIMDNAIEYLNKGDNNFDMLWHYKCNKPDTVQNVNQIFKLLKEDKALADELAEELDAAHIMPIYFSLNADHSGKLASITLGRDASDLHTFIIDDTKVVLSEKQAGARYAMNASEFSKQYTEFVTQHTVLNSTDFNKKFVELIEQYETMAVQRDVPARISFVGFNNKSDSLGMDNVLTNYMIIRGHIS